MCVRESSTPPEGEFRRQAAKVMFSDKVGLISIVFEGSGFRAAIVRSVIAMIFTLGGRLSTPHKITDDPRLCARWFADKTAKETWSPDAGDVQQVLEAMMHSS